ncbi:hypothetical protein NQ315_014938 [Exocentrus adspersus]|uniref:HTH psq-type domain-containing protein n=1 Tax=Exocentrus adspersus TaxID=1586481 RepID=A0AAV8VB01_9CUCU|nr:hypothetical protein NQ315_014938 [Exocentrus adspersus]
MTVKDASETYKIPVRTLYYKIKGCHPCAPGGQQVLSEIEERHLVDVVIACGEYGPPVNEVEEYFENLSRSLVNVPPQNILNFDESNLTDDPGAKKCIFRRGIKYPERVMNTSKSAISIMFAASAAGTVLPPYVERREAV